MRSELGSTSPPFHQILAARSTSPQVLRPISQADSDTNDGVGALLGEKIDKMANVYQALKSTISPEKLKRRKASDQAKALFEFAKEKYSIL